MKSILRGVGILSFLIISLVLAVPAQAHAILVRSVPDANATLPRAPAQIELFFSEPVDPNFVDINVLDAAGKRVDANDARVDPTNAEHVTISLGSLNNGVYIVAYSVVSAADGHATGGSFPFAVGQENAAAVGNITSSSTSSISVGEVLTKGWLYLAAAALMGGILFTFLVWRPSLSLVQLLPGDLPAFQPLAQKLAWAGLISLFLADFLSFLVQAGQASGAAIASPFSPAVGTLLLNSRLGALAIARLGLGFALMGLLAPPANRWNRWVAFAAGLLLLITFSLESHAAAEAHPWLPVLADWVHLTAVSVWVGGLFHFAAGMWAVRGLDGPRRTRLSALLVPHFSNLALTSVGVLTLTGVYSAVLRVGSFAALIDTPYGQALDVKLILAAVMVAFGAFNLLVTTPALRRAAAQPAGDANWVNRFRWLVTAETVLGGVLLVWVGFFTALPPAQAVSTPAGYNAVARVDDLTVSLNIDPAHVGVNTFTVTLSSGGKRVSDAQRVTLEFASLSGKVPTTAANLTNLGNGVYSLKGGYLGLADQWYLQVAVVRQGKFDAYSSFRINLVSGTAQSLPWKTVSISLLFAAAACYTLAFRAVDRNPLSWLVFGVLPALALVVGGILMLAKPAPTVAADPINPVSPNAASVTAGQGLYTQNCQTCHGVSGKGDGPQGLALNPHPADLSAHAVPGVHTDGQLFNWITNGFPNSAMPAFRQKLSDTQRWDLVNFIRTFAPKQ